MPDGNYQNQKGIIIYLVNDSVLADANTPSVSTGELPDSGRPGIVGQGTDSRNYAVAVRSRDVC